MKKKSFFKSVAVFAALVCATFATISCSDDEKDPNEIVGVEISYQLSFNQDFVNVADFYIYYLNEKGEQVKEPITTTNWEKRVTLRNFPCKYGLYVKAEMKNPYPYEDSKYIDLRYERNMDVSPIKRNGSRGSTITHFNNEVKTSFQKSDVIAYLQGNGEKFDYQGHIFTKSGAESWTDIPWVFD